MALVVRSSQDPQMLSLRGPGGAGDGVKKYITESFKEGDKLVLLRKSDFDRLKRSQG